MASIAMNSANNQYAPNINSYGITQPEWLTSELCTGVSNKNSTAILYMV